MAVTFDLNKIFKFRFDILKDNRNFHINSGFLQKFNPECRAKTDKIIYYVFGALKIKS